MQCAFNGYRLTDKQATKTSHFNVHLLRFPKVSAKPRALSKQFFNNEPNIRNAFTVPDSQADNPKKHKAE